MPWKPNRNGLRKLPAPGSPLMGVFSLLSTRQRAFRVEIFRAWVPRNVSR